MTEEAPPEDDSYIVRVKAVVMSRDDSSGGWLPHEGGGLSRVGVSKVYSEGGGRSDFLIHGERLKDKLIVMGSAASSWWMKLLDLPGLLLLMKKQWPDTIWQLLNGRMVSLECYLKKDLVYWKANPTFHHWLVDNKRFGLTFQSPADARAFDRGVRKAIEDLTEGSTTSSSTIHNEAELGDDDVFATSTDSSSNSSQKREPPVRTIASPLASGRCRYSTLSHIDLYGLDHYPPEQSLPRPPRHVSFPDDDDEIVRINPRERNWLTGYEDYRQAPIHRKYPETENIDSYVRFTKSESSKHDYNYPYVDHSNFGMSKDLKSSVINTQPTRCKSRRKDGERSRCMYCRDMFNHDENRRGQCQDAPDSVRNCIRRVSCMGFADCVLYHCMSDPEGDYTDACSCDTSDEKFCLRWMLLIPLSIIAPGMCCYLPLRACYNCGVMCGCCGGKHKAAG